MLAPARLHLCHIKVHSKPQPACTLPVPACRRWGVLPGAAGLLVASALSRHGASQAPSGARMGVWMHMQPPALQTRLRGVRVAVFAPLTVHPLPLLRLTRASWEY